MTESEYFLYSHIGRDVYGLLAYKLPLERWLGNLRITPYVFAEYSLEDDTFPFQKFDWVTVGLNVRPSPSAVFKLQYDDINSIHDDSQVESIEGYQGLLVQMAVTY